MNELRLLASMMEYTYPAQSVSKGPPPLPKTTISKAGSDVWSMTSWSTFIELCSLARAAVDFPATEISIRDRN